MKKLNILIVTAVLTIQTLILIYFLSGNEKIGYIELGKIYTEFSLKKNLDKQLENIVNARRLSMDSLEIELKLLSSKLNTINEKSSEFSTLARDFEYKKQQFFLRREALEKENQALTARFEEQILTQLNQYVSEFGNLHGYKYILGADGSGSLMYADKASNITEEVSSFIELKIAGK
jgi:outer membrane protein